MHHPSDGGQEHEIDIASHTGISTTERRYRSVSNGEARLRSSAAMGVVCVRRCGIGAPDAGKGVILGEQKVEDA